MAFCFGFCVFADMGMGFFFFSHGSFFVVLCGFDAMRIGCLDWFGTAPPSVAICQQLVFDLFLFLMLYALAF